MQKECGCVLPRPADELVQSKNMTFCESQETVECVATLRKRTFSTCSNGCLPACATKKFEGTSSKSKFPSEATLQWLKLNNVSNVERWAKNYILLQIFFEELEVCVVFLFHSLMSLYCITDHQNQSVPFVNS